VAIQRKRSRRGAILVLILMLLSAASVVEWWRSQANFTSARWAGFVAMTAEGKICLLHSSNQPAKPVLVGFHSVPYNRADADGIIIRWPMFDYGWTTDARGDSRISLVMPLWVVAMLFALPTAWWFGRGREAARLADEMG
jgi:hypothetical protein